MSIFFFLLSFNNIDGIASCFPTSFTFRVLICFLHCCQPVRRGTNGGVTKTGLLAAAAAGSVVGLSFVLPGFLSSSCITDDVTLKQLLVIPLSTLAGLGGSLVDSLLGATLQFSGFCSVRNKVLF